MYQQIIKYFSRHPTFNAVSHLLIGIGTGILITRPFVGIHPIRVGVFFILIGLLGHLYPMLYKVK